MVYAFSAMLPATMLSSIPSNLVGREDFLRESFRDASAVQNVPYAREIDN